MNVSNIYLPTVTLYFDELYFDKGRNICLSDVTG